MPMIEVGLFSCLNIISIFFDFYSFYKISKIKSKMAINIFFIIIYTSLSIIIDLQFLNTGIVISNVVFILLLYVFFYKKLKNFRVFLSASIIPLIFDLLMDVITQIFQILFKGKSNLNVIIEVSILCLYFLVINFINKYSNKINFEIIGREGHLLFGLLIYFYASIFVVFTVNIYLKQKEITAIIFALLLIFQLIFMSIVFYLIVRLQKQTLNEKLNKQKHQSEYEKRKQLEEYAGYLEKSEDELRAFRHDYRNMLNSLKISAREGNTQEVIDLLDKYTQANLNSNALLKYKDVNHVHIKSVKSIIISKLTEIYDLNIPYNFECRQVIKQIPDVNEIDLIRIIGITCDNAIEESQLMLEKGLKPEIQIMFYSNSKDEFEYEIRNKIHDKNISASQIQKKGFTTKKNHQGLGLTNIRNIENRYPNMTISHTVEDGWFDFYMMIDAEDGE